MAIESSKPDRDSRSPSFAKISSVKEVGTLELGCGENPDDRADTCCDVRDLPTVDVRQDLDEIPWKFPDGCADGVIMNHVIEHLSDPVSVMFEIGRILKPGGWVELTVPIGALRFRDPTHQNHWNFRTPEYFAVNGSAPERYEFEAPPLMLTDRRFGSLWFTVPLVKKLSPLLRTLANRRPGVWVSGTPWVAGELVVEYERI